MYYVRCIRRRFRWGWFYSDKVIVFLSLVVELGADVVHRCMWDRGRLVSVLVQELDPPMACYGPIDLDSVVYRPRALSVHFFEANNTEYLLALDAQKDRPQLEESLAFLTLCHLTSLVGVEFLLLAKDRAS